MRYPHGLQLDIGVESDPFEDIGCQRLVGVVAEPALEVGEVEVSVWSGVEVAKHTAFAPAVPHSVARPLGCLGLADGDGLAAGAIDAGRGNPGGELVSNRGEVCERGLEPSLGLSPGLLGWEMSRTVGQAGGSGAAGFCSGGRGSQGRRRGAGGGLRGMPSTSKEGACPKSSRGPEEASSGCTRSAHPSRRLSPDETLPSRELTRA